MILAVSLFVILFAVVSTIIYIDYKYEKKTREIIVGNIKMRFHNEHTQS